ncbi:phosphomannomutase/phosphoglucomutase [Alloalcanivorax xenomutans]|uniref:phosphomannomutase/phosphoglucomutase n=1 Tax=Alloalcanivorax xenomutans TaxID=1094342 RepID=UPI0024E24CBC|nr:phosphomannomutase/phosphoglucomutase [Alloalcanivorax xenomutans]
MSLMLSDTIFRAYDIRGVYGEDLDDHAAYWIGKAIGSEVLEHNEADVMVGRDGRLSTPALASCLIDGIRSSGCNVVDLGMLPSPALYFAVCSGRHWASGVMVTGSHNPRDYNGFKVLLKGKSLGGAELTKLKERVETGNLNYGLGKYKEIDIKEDYIFEVLRRHAAPNKKFKLVLDFGNGVGGILAPRIFSELGCSITTLFEDVDGRFPNHHPDPSIPEYMTELKDVVLREKADFGFAFDGDADRLGVVLPDGSTIYSDIVLMALAEDLLSRCPGAKILFDVKCTSAVFDVIQRAGGRAEMCQTGHSPIKAKMRESHALLAGEMSGHFYFQDDWFGVDDPIVAAIRLLRAVDSGGGKPLDFFNRYPTLFSTPEITVNVAEEKKFVVIERLRRLCVDEPGIITDMDGIRIDYEDGWGLCRASNTSPKLVLRFEGASKEALENIRKRISDKVEIAMKEALEF